LQTGRTANRDGYIGDIAIDIFARQPGRNELLDFLGRATGALNGADEGKAYRAVRQDLDRPLQLVLAPHIDFKLVAGIDAVDGKIGSGARRTCSSRSGLRRGRHENVSACRGRAQRRAKTKQC
jgi:hypothetical protein